MSPSAPDVAESHTARAMDSMYRWQSAIYDLTRKPYLLGRDRLIDALDPPPGSAVLEVGCGTGRNLVAAARRWPDARFFGYDVSSVMLGVADKSVSQARLGARIALAQGDACLFDPRAAFNEPRFARIYFSYVLSMIPQWRVALARAADLLEPGAQLRIADFGDQHAMAPLARSALTKWLAMFHVEPRRDLAATLETIAAERGLVAETRQIYRGYAVLASLRRPD